MLTTHTYIDKTNTIIEASGANLGVNAVMSLTYGDTISRAILHFDTSRIEELVGDMTYPDTSRLTHTLKLFNAASVDQRRINCTLASQDLLEDKQRAVSFDLIVFTLPAPWDEGRGCDESESYSPIDRRAYSEYASNWYNSATETPWRVPGIYTTDELAEELEKYENGDASIIVGVMHFDHGNEQPSLDITSYVNSILDGTADNNGLGIAFSPDLEASEQDMAQYIGFFSAHTNTYFRPYVESVYDDTVSDDRLDFYVGKENRLYFYAYVGGKAVNVSSVSCTINGTAYTVAQATKGVYYVTVDGSSFSEDTMYYDTWTFTYEGTEFTRELYFTPKANDKYLSFGLPYETQDYPRFTPTLHGIRNRENVVQGDVRKVTVECVIDYTSDQLYPVDTLEYRVYTIMGGKQIDVYPWSAVDRGYNENFFYVVPEEMMPGEYHVDIRASYDMERIITSDALTFYVARNFSGHRE